MHEHTHTLGTKGPEKYTRCPQCTGYRTHYFQHQYYISAKKQIQNNGLQLSRNCIKIAFKKWVGSEK